MRGKIRRLDGPLLLIALALCAVGLVNVYSGTRVMASPGVPLFLKQLVWVGAGVAVFFLFYLLGDGLIEELSYPFYAAALGLLVLVLLVGHSRMGAQRWISVGGFNVQPSEFAKIGLILALAREFSRRYRHEGIGVAGILPAVGLAGLPFLLVALQPDLGTAGIFLIVLASMMVVARVKARVFAVLAGLGTAALPGLWFFMKDYQRHRVLTFLDPEADPMGKGYHVIQSKIAVGSGGVLGKGYLHGTQGALRFLPEQHTDFAFAVFAEEWGLVGSLVLLGLFVSLIYRGFWLATLCQDRYAAIACGGLTAYLLAHVLINTAMVCGLFPVVGIPLPFISYGGSSMMTNMTALGILANLARSRFRFQGRGEEGAGPIGA